MNVRKIAVAATLALAAAGAAFAATDTKAPADQDRDGPMHHRMHGMPFSVERVAMHNIMAELLSAKTGRSQDEIRALFEGNDPRDAIEKLGLSHDDMRALFQQAHLTLIQKAQAAGLITADQAAKLKAAPLPDHHGPRPDDDGGPHGDGPRE